MTTGGCRIGRVRLKSGGVIEAPAFSTESETPFARDLRHHMGNILAWWGHTIKGYYLIVWDEDGDMTTSCRIDPKQIPPHLLPAYISEIVRDRTVIEPAVLEIQQGRRS